MMQRRAVRVVPVAVATTVLLALVGAPRASDAKAPTGRLYVVQAVPGATYSVQVDERNAGSGVDVGRVLGPFDLPAGEHDVVFTSDGATTTTTVRVRAGSSSDVVLHRPAAEGGDPVVDVYQAPTDPIAPGKARVLVAHTATVPPADVRVDGQTVFANIANGEFAVADVAAGAHRAALVPAGSSGPPILGPLDVDLPESTLTRVYAVGTPRNGSMNVIAHQVPLASDGSVVPGRIDTGSAGLVGDLRVVAFGSR